MTVSIAHATLPISSSCIYRCKCTDCSGRFLKTLTIELFDARPDAKVIGCIRDRPLAVISKKVACNTCATAPWNTLEWLQPKCCPISSSSEEGLVQAYLPNMQELSFVNVGLEAVDHTWAHPVILVTGNCLHFHTLYDFDIYDQDILALTGACWPALRSLTMVGLFHTTMVFYLCMQR